MTSNSGSNTTRLRISFFIALQDAEPGGTNTVLVNKSNNFLQP